MSTVSTYNKNYRLLLSQNTSKKERIKAGEGELGEINRNDKALWENLGKETNVQHHHSQSHFCPSQQREEVWEQLQRSIGGAYSVHLSFVRPVPLAGLCLLFQLALNCLWRANLGSSLLSRERTCLPAGAPGTECRVFLSGPQRWGGVQKVGGRTRTLGLAVNGSTVCFGFPRRADYPHETVSELLQDQPLRLCLRLVSLFGPFGLFQ